MKKKICLFFILATSFITVTSHYSYADGGHPSPHFRECSRYCSKFEESFSDEYFYCIEGCIFWMELPL